MKVRSLLFVPGDRPDRMRKALDRGADALILDLEDSVSSERKTIARQAVADFLAQSDRKVLERDDIKWNHLMSESHSQSKTREHDYLSTKCYHALVFVRVNPLATDAITADLNAIAAARPDGIVLPKAESGACVVDLSNRLTALGETEARILPIVTETPKAIFGLGSYINCSPRLCGLTWGAEDLPAAIGATHARELDGSYTTPYKIVRALTLFAAHAANAMAIDAVYPNFKDLEGLAAYAARGRRDGFSAMLAIHPDQIPIINAAFTPTKEEMTEAYALIELFAANPGVGALNFNGRMVDAPHLMAARRLLNLECDSDIK